MLNELTNLRGNRQRCCSRKLAIKESVEVVTSGAVDEEAKGPHTKRSHSVIGFTILIHKILGKAANSKEIL